MKIKHFITLAVIMLIPVTIKAQWGITAGFNTSRSTDIDAVDSSLGLQMSTYYNFKLWKGLSYKPQFIISNERLTKKIGGEQNYGGYGVSNIYRQEIRQNAFYGTFVPIDFAYLFNIQKSKLVIDLGLYTAIGMFGQSNYEIWDAKNYWKSPNTETFPSRDRFDYGITAGISFIHNHIIASIQAKYGLKTIDPISYGKLETYMFSVGYQF